MSLTSLTGQPTHYPKLNDMTAGEVIFERGKFIKSEPGKKFPNSTNWIFEVDEPIVNEKGEFKRVGVSAGQITKAMQDQEDPNGFYKLVYSGSREIEKGQWAGSKAHTFDLAKYDEGSSIDAAGIKDVEKNTKAAEASRATESKSSGDSLDDMMN